MLFRILSEVAARYSGYDKRKGKSVGLLMVHCLSNNKPLWERLKRKDKMEMLRSFLSENFKAYLSMTRSDKRLWLDDALDPLAMYARKQKAKMAKNIWETI